MVRRLKKERGGLKQENISITEALVKQQCKKMPNWKSTRARWYSRVLDQKVHNIAQKDCRSDGRYDKQQG